LMSFAIINQLQVDGTCRVGRLTVGVS